jgi:hypothetical protein
MQLYADSPGRRAAQVTADIAAVVWIVVWTRVAVWLHDLVLLLAEPGAALESAGDSLDARVSDAADVVAGVPGIGDDLRQPFDVIAGAGADIAAAGARQQEVVSDVALALSALLLVIAISVVLVGWLPWRARWIARTRAARDLLAGNPDPSLFALRALSHRSLRQLQRVHPDPARAWRAGDPVATAALADLELAALGLRVRRPR